MTQSGGRELESQKGYSLRSFISVFNTSLMQMGFARNKRLKKS